MKCTFGQRPNSYLFQKSEKITEKTFIPCIDAHHYQQQQCLFQMQIRVQLVENNPLHRVPSIFLNVGNSQFLFNVIPTLIRHRHLHKLQLNKSTHIFFTKNSIEAIGGLPNYMLFRSGIQNSNQKLANNIYLYGDNQMINYLEKLRFKIGYKALRFSFCNWKMNKYRYGISSLKLYKKIYNDPAIFDLFIKIQDYLRRRCKKQDYFDSKAYLRNEKTEKITIDSTYFCSEQVNIHPLYTRVGGMRFTHYICTFPSQPSILIFHYSNNASLKAIKNLEVLKNFFENNNQTELVIHIVEDKSILRSIQFANLISKFGPKTQHMWFGHQFNPKSQELLVQQEYNMQEQNIWCKLFPDFFKNIYLERLKFNEGINQEYISQLFPFMKNIIYKKAYSYIRDEVNGYHYTQRKDLNLASLQKLLKNIERNKEQINLLQEKAQKMNKATKLKKKVIFLGTNSSMPTTKRNTSGIFVSFNRQSNIILDCGEETYQQMANHFSPLQFQQQLLKTRIIFITHIHSDHNIGILNLISERQRLLRKRGQQSKLYLIIPFNVYNWYAQYNSSIEDLSQSCDVLFTQVILSQPYQVQIQKEMNRQKQRKIKENGISTCNLNTFEDIYFSEIQTSAKTKDLVSKQLPNQKNILEAFNSLLKLHGYQEFLPVRVIHCPQSFGIIIKYRQFKLSYSGDTRPSLSFQESARGSDLMIHEATFNYQLSWKAEKYKHSTVEQAVKIGCDSGSKQLALTHFNSLFKIPSQIHAQQQYKDYFDKKTIFAMDHFEIPLKVNPLLPALSKLVSSLSHSRDKD